MGMRGGGKAGGRTNNMDAQAGNIENMLKGLQAWS